MSSFFVDSSYLIAVANERDQFHRQAKQHWEELLSTYPSLHSTDYVFDEFVTAVKRRTYHELAVSVGRQFRVVMDLSPIREDVFERAWEFFCRHDDKTYSFTDCTSFVVMADIGLTTALAFDSHFEQAGFLTEP